jgi:hypothetical protein
MITGHFRVFQAIVTQLEIVDVLEIQIWLDTGVLFELELGTSDHFVWDTFSW